MSKSLIHCYIGVAVGARGPSLCELRYGKRSLEKIHPELTSKYDREGRRCFACAGTVHDLEMLTEQGWKQP